MKLFEIPKANVIHINLNSEECAVQIRFHLDEDLRMWHIENVKNGFPFQFRFDNIFAYLNIEHSSKLIELGQHYMRLAGRVNKKPFEIGFNWNNNYADFNDADIIVKY